jgi:hypothetical protein
MALFDDDYNVTALKRELKDEQELSNYYLENWKDLTAQCERYLEHVLNPAALQEEKDECLDLFVQAIRNTKSLLS